MKDEKSYDIDYYRQNLFESVHIGDFKLKEETKISEYPLVGVVLPVYNGYQYLKEAIDSVLQQTYKNVILIIINDGSTEKEVSEIIHSYKDDRIVIVEN